MKLKKIVFFIVVSMMVLLNSVCFASIGDIDLEIGGIYYGQPMDEIVNKYGDSIRTIPTPPVGKEFVFVVDGSEIILRPEDGMVIKATISNKSQLDTLKGIKIGSTFKDVLATYGDPTSIKNYSGIYCVDYFTPEVIVNDSNVVSYHNVLRFHMKDDLVLAISFFRNYKYQSISSDW